MVKRSTAYWELLLWKFYLQVHVTSDYSLHGHRDAVCTSCPGTTLYDHLSTWDRWHAKEVIYDCWAFILVIKEINWKKFFALGLVHLIKRINANKSYHMISFVQQFIEIKISKYILSNKKFFENDRQSRFFVLKFIDYLSNKMNAFRIYRYPFLC